MLTATCHCGAIKVTVPRKPQNDHRLQLLDLHEVRCVVGVLQRIDRAGGGERRRPRTNTSGVGNINASSGARAAAASCIGSAWRRTRRTTWA